VVGPDGRVWRVEEKKEGGERHKGSGNGFEKRKEREKRTKEGLVCLFFAQNGKEEAGAGLGLAAAQVALGRGLEYGGGRRKLSAAPEGET